jgi:argininosuccinate lyase
VVKSGKKKEPSSGRQSSGIRKGRFAAAMDPLFARFNASIGFDRRLAAEDVQGSIAHVRMLGAQGIVTKEEANAIEHGLLQVLKEVEQGKLQFQEELEDVHINIEEALRSHAGSVAGKLHTARSRNDQVALDLRLYLRNQSILVMSEVVALMTALTDASDANIDLVMPGYTHLQRAQPVRLAHHLMAYFQMFQRDWQRFADWQGRADEMPLGSAALAGTTFPIDRKRVAQELGFARVSSNSMDAVSDRDFVVEFTFCATMVMMHLSRLAEELIMWSSAEFGFCSLPDEFCSGSSIMPQKKNPDACELVRGKTGRVYGDLISLLTTLKALPLTYNKDLQEDKEPVFDALDTVRGCLGIMAGLVPRIEFRGDRMLEASSDPALAATDLADELVRQGVPFREAHARIGAMMADASTGSRQMEQAEGLPTPEDMVEARSHIGGTSRDMVRDQIREARSFLEARKTVRSSRSG